MALPESARFSEAGFRDEEANKKPFAALQSILSCLMVEAEKNLLFTLHLNGWLAWTTPKPPACFRLDFWVNSN